MNYTCELSGAKNNLVVHHIKGYNLILDEAFLLCNIEQKDDFNDYTMDELHQLFDAFFIYKKKKNYIFVFTNLFIKNFIVNMVMEIIQKNNGMNF
ncbi:hypothetical protein SD457_06210 [Coprobacillaceae bacterium CR2/5/TPMF4]|nr:hypothetical protein SD457_06210 [Coprobacillaceae bacterium CR2/5/TPMF4]